jgi:HJR/Mrr/RecB family endonuclease
MDDIGQKYAELHAAGHPPKNATELLYACGLKEAAELNIVHGADLREKMKQIREAKRNTNIRPQPIDYGLTGWDMHEAGLLRGHEFDKELEYKAHKVSRGRVLVGCICFLALFFLASIGISRIPKLQDYWFLYALSFAYLTYVISWYAILEPIANAHKRRTRTSVKLSAYKEALRVHELNEAAAREAEQAAHEAEQALLRQKRSYWERLNGYDFERETAEVLKRHQFNPKLTGGSADGGVDIEVARGSRKGVVQCKAHVTCVGPHTVRDLFGVMHHSGADFGIIVSRGGFTKGAIDFARNKRIFLIETSDLIAMQEGQDVLAGGFTHADV